MDPPRRVRRRRHLVLRGSLAVLLSMGAMELVMRTWISTPATNVPDAEFKYFERPGSWQVQSREGYSRSSTNELGFFDDPIPQDDGRPRALILGDSYVEAKQVARSNSLTAVANSASTRAVVMNAARSGWSPPDLAHYATTRIHAFDPDVLVVVYNASDLFQFEQSNSVVLRQDERGRATLRVPRHPTSFGRLRESLQDLRRSSALITAVHRRLKQLVALEQERLASRFAKDFDERRTSEEFDFEACVASFVTLHEMVVEATGLPVIYVYVPPLEYAAQQARIDFPERRDVLREFSRRVGARFVDPTSMMVAEYGRTGRPLHGFVNSRIGEGHINAAGHRIVGEAIARAIDEALQ